MLDERRRLDQDRRDEVWRGEYHMNPWPNRRHAILEIELLNVITPAAKAVGLTPSGGFNLGRPEDYRAPDGGLHRDRDDAVYARSAALVLEVVSPGDESWLKFDFYAAHGVDEIVIVDGEDNRLHWFVLRGEAYEPVERSGLLDLDVAVVQGAIDWS